MGMDFIGPLPETERGHKYILMVVDYFTRYIIPFPTKTANVVDVLGLLDYVFDRYRRPQAIYCDQGHHFDNKECREWLNARGITIDYSGTGASKSTGMVELSNKLLEAVIRRKSGMNDVHNWDLTVTKSSNAVNNRIIHHLNMSPSSILFGESVKVAPIAATLLALPGRDIKQWHDDLQDPDRHHQSVRDYLFYKADTHDRIEATDAKHKLAMKRQYEKGVCESIHHINDLVMVWQKQQGKLEPRWRGPFRIVGYGGAHGLTFKLAQLNGKAIRGIFHGDHLKLFKPRGGYLSDLTVSTIPKETYPSQQTIRRPKAGRTSRSMIAKH